MSAFQNSSKSANKTLSYSKILTLTLALIVGIGTASATDLNNIETITPSGTSPINITGQVDMGGNSITSFFGSACASGNVAVHVNDDGTLDCVDATNEVSQDFVERAGDTMTGTLDMQGNDISSVGSLQADNISLTGGYGTGGINLNNERLFGLDSFAFNDAGPDGNIAWGGAGAEIYAAPLDDSNSDGYLQIVNDGGIAFEPSTDGTTAATFTTNNNFNMRGNSITNFFGSTCGSGNVAVHVNDDGTIDCVDATNQVSNDFVSRSGDTMTGNLDIQQNYLTITNSDGDYYLGGGNTPDSATSGVHLETGSNPNAGDAIFVVESSGGSERLRVEHSGTTSTSNSFDAAGGFTEAGSNTLSNDISGDADTLDGNHGSYYLDNTDSQDLGYSNDNAPTGNYVTHSVNIQNGANINIRDYYDPDTTIADNQNLGFTAGSPSISNYVTHTVSIDNGNGASIRDYYEADTTIADNQNLGTSRSGSTVSISIDNGNGASFTDNYEANTDASTKCAGADYLAGDGTCNVDSYQANTDNQGLSNVISNGNSIGTGQTIDASAGAFRLPVGTDAY